MDSDGVWLGVGLGWVELGYRIIRMSAHLSISSSSSLVNVSLIASRTPAENGSFSPSLRRATSALCMNALEG